MKIEKLQFNTKWSYEFSSSMILRRFPKLRQLRNIFKAAEMEIPIVIGFSKRNIYTFNRNPWKLMDA